MRDNGKILIPNAEQMQAFRAQQQIAAQQQQLAQQAFALENARAVAAMAATLHADGLRSPQEAVDLACELLFRSLTTLSLPRTAAREAEIKATLTPADQ